VDKKFPSYLSIIAATLLAAYAFLRYGKMFYAQLFTASSGLSQIEFFAIVLLIVFDVGLLVLMAAERKTRKEQIEQLNAAIDDKLSIIVEQQFMILNNNLRSLEQSIVRLEEHIFKLATRRTNE